MLHTLGGDVLCVAPSGLFAIRLMHKLTITTVMIIIMVIVIITIMIIILSSGYYNVNKSRLQYIDIGVLFFVAVDETFYANRSSIHRLHRKFVCGISSTLNTCNRRLRRICHIWPGTPRTKFHRHPSMVTIAAIS